MIQILAKNQKIVALLLATLFYCDFILAGYTKTCLLEKYRDMVNNFSCSPGKIDFYDDQEFFCPSVNYDQDSSAVAYESITDSLQINNREEYDDKDFTGGPSQPEMQSFQSVNNNNMVDLFTGDFSYNIPLMDVGGYPINLSYRSGITMDQEASWVGLGWNVNPGTITRNMRGLPDDFNGVNDTITKTASIKKNSTIGISGGVELNSEVAGIPLPFQLGFSGGIFHNSYRGWGLEGGMDVSLSVGNASKGALSGGLGVNIINNSQSGLTLSPSLYVNLGEKDAQEKGGLTGSMSTSFAYNSRTGIKSLDLTTGIRLYIVDKKNLTFGIGTELSPSISFATTSYTPTITLPYTSTQYTYRLKLGGAFDTWFPNGYIQGYTSTQEIKPQDQTLALPAYGYINYQNANQNPSALLDFNREKEIAYRENPPIPNIAIPNYTYDVFSITGEGTGGMFRPYRSDIGFIYDHYIKTKDQTDGFSGEIGWGNLVHIGADVNLNSAYTENSPWLSANTLKDITGFKHADSTFEAVYFKNPGEKSINSKQFYDAIGGDDVVTGNLYQAGINSSYISATNYLRRYNKATFLGDKLLTKDNAFKKERDKRSQVITYLTAEEAGIAGISKYIENYAANRFGLRNCNREFPESYALDTFKVNDTVSIEKRVNSFRQPNHISEMDVLNADGRRYIYGIPVYNLYQKEAGFSVDHSLAKTADGLVKYTHGSDDATINNVNNTDHYFTSEVLPPYAHSFLLTAILSPDYVDLTGDGVSDDDLGDAVKFNYSKVSGIHNPFGWRTPYNDSATYNECLRSDYKDDKGSYVYGEKELWYLHSIESKTMVAIFWVHDRSDLLSIDVNGTRSQQNAKKLDSIQLFTKADFLSKGIAATAIKTVHFSYYTPGNSNELCKGLNAAAGKLTLQKIWFSYNGNSSKYPQNQYFFYYHSTNPGYNIKSYDRWGNYKDPARNPASLPNAEYPYTIQSSYSDSAAAAWSLDSIILPSGGRMKVTYESDDYAYVQNRRAMQLFTIAYLSTDSTGTQNHVLYNSPYGDNLYVFVTSAQLISSRQDLYYKFLEGVEKIYFKLYVKMPPDGTGLTSYDYVPCYADLDVTPQDGGYGLKSDGHTFWIRLKGISLGGDQDGPYSPLAKAAIQFLRLNLPSRAYPKSDVGDNLGIKEFIQMISALADNISTAFTNFDVNARYSNWAKVIDMDRSFIRLDNPCYKKYGGGLRVKSIKIYDNWNVMTSPDNPANGQKQSVYGQEYDYTVIKTINGVPTRISSGVASYEPMIGGEENPFHQPLRYTEKTAPLAPVTLGYTEEPLGESFFPSPGVGYSKVRVRSVNAKKRKSANGYEETTFYTTYDFPTITDNSLINDDNKKRYKPRLADFLRINAKHYLTMSQGFKVELNDMNGKMRSQATYPETDSTTAISSTENFYQVDDQRAEVKHLSNTVMAVNEQGEIDTTAVIGKDVELMNDMRQQSSITSGANIGVNLDVFLIALPPPISIFMSIPIPQREEDLYRSVATTKIIQRYGILDSVVHVEKGSLVSTKNLLYDAETGDVLLTRTNNEFNDPVYNFTYPAHWAYSGMGQAYKNINAVFSDVTINNGIPQYTGRYPNFKNYFESGDEILATGKLKIGESPAANCDGIPVSCPVPLWSGMYTTEKIWAVDARKIDSSNYESIVFIDGNGKSYSADSVAMKIIRSGRRNMSAAPVGAITCFKNPVQVKSGKLKIVFDTSSQVVSTTAAVFKDLWKVNDAEKMTSGDDSCACGPLKKLFDYLIASNRLFIQQSDMVTVDSIVHAAADAGYSVDINDCSLLSNNETGLFYAVTDDVSGTLYAAHIGNNIVYLTSEDLITINFYSLQSKACTGGNKVYYQDNSRVEINYHVYNHSGSDITYAFINCETGHYGLTLKAGHDTCIYALQGKVFIPNISDVDTVTGICTGSPRVCDISSIYLAVQSCDSCPAAGCYDAILNSSMNPYMYGILGNWRPDRSYVYYGQRQETDLNTATDIRKNGTIKDFAPFWSFSNTYLQPSSDSSRWVWNSQTTLFNKKGYELENKDPLGRYNSGQYGYNQSLPVSVTQNSKFREQLFDGFEDYLYNGQNCVVSCTPGRNIDFTSDGGLLDTVYRHSGRYSLKVGAGDSVAVDVPVIPSLEDTISQKLIADVDVKIVTDTVVTPNGSGLTLSFDSNSHPVMYTGYIQPLTSGYYTITSNISYTNYPSAPLGYSMEIDGHSTARYDGEPQLSYSILLLAGEKYPIIIDRVSGSYFTGPLSLTWSKCDVTTTSIPTLNRYRYPDYAPGSVVIDTASDCSKLKGITADSASLLPSFSPTQGGKYWLSAWVKENVDCLCKSYVSNQVKFLITDSSGQQTVITARPTGNIIDGWQRYDSVINIPAGAVSISVKLMATGASDVYFDDIRMHPFNANMKSFVYDPVNLRLMAELDENNYATYYEYDDDGTLIRVKKETQRGIRTIKETRSYLIKDVTQ